MMTTTAVERAPKIERKATSRMVLVRMMGTTIMEAAIMIHCFTVTSHPTEEARKWMLVPIKIKYRTGPPKAIEL
jgi:hypothetical protein